MFNYWGPAMESYDLHDMDTTPVMTNLPEEAEPQKVTSTPQPWLRRFASVVGFASAGVASPGGSQMFS